MEDEGDVPPRAGVPSLSTHEVASVAPSYRVPTSLSHGVLRVAAAVRPPRVEISIVGAHRVAGHLALVKGGNVGIFALNDVSENIQRRAEGAQCSRAGEEQGGE